MKTYGLEPLDMHNCLHCTHMFYDIDNGYGCDKHRDEDLKGLRLYEVNDCTDWSSPFLSTGNTTPVYDRRINKKLKERR